MTQDQYGQARGPGYVVPGDGVPDDETEEFTSDQDRPVTRFQKVASAQASGEAWDEPAPEAGRAEAVAVTSPDATDHQATEPDMFGTTAHAGNGVTAAPAARTPGDFSDLTYGNLIPDAAQYTDQWQKIQYKFVDDPHASVTEAADIVAQVTAKMEAAIQERQRAIAEQQRALRDRWGDSTNADTEALRETLRMYKTFLDQLIGPRAG